MTQQDLEEFQKKHGRAWAKIIELPSFNAGMVHLSIQAMETIKRLSDQEIKDNSAIILADLRGRLRHETELFSLPVLIEPEVTDDVREDYPNSIDEHFAEHQRQENLAKKL